MGWRADERGAAKVAELDVPRGGEEHVLGFHVAVHDVARVQELDDEGELRAVEAGLRGGQGAPAGGGRGGVTRARRRRRAAERAASRGHPEGIIDRPMRQRIALGAQSGEGGGRGAPALDEREEVSGAQLERHVKTLRVLGERRSRI